MAVRISGEQPLFRPAGWLLTDKGKLKAGLEKYNQKYRKGPELPPLNIGFFRFHFEFETGHVANVENELAEVLKREEFDQTKWLWGATKALDAILVFWKGLDKTRHQLAK